MATKKITSGCIRTDCKWNYRFTHCQYGWWCSSNVPVVPQSTLHTDVSQQWVGKCSSQHLPPVFLMRLLSLILVHKSIGPGLSFGAGELICPGDSPICAARPPSSAHGWSGLWLSAMVRFQVCSAALEFPVSFILPLAWCFLSVSYHESLP